MRTERITWRGTNTFYPRVRFRLNVGKCSRQMPPCIGWLDLPTLALSRLAFRLRGQPAPKLSRTCPYFSCLPFDPSRSSERNLETRDAGRRTSWWRPLGRQQLLRRASRLSCVEACEPKPELELACGRSFYPSLPRLAASSMAMTRVPSRASRSCPTSSRPLARSSRTDRTS